MAYGIAWPAGFLRDEFMIELVCQLGQRGGCQRFGNRLDQDSADWGLAGFGAPGCWQRLLLRGAAKGRTFRESYYPAKAGCV